MKVQDQAGGKSEWERGEKEERGERGGGLKESAEAATHSLGHNRAKAELSSSTDLVSLNWGLTRRRRKVRDEIASTASESFFSPLEPEFFGSCFCVFRQLVYNEISVSVFFPEMYFSAKTKTKTQKMWRREILLRCCFSHKLSFWFKTEKFLAEKKKEELVARGSRRWRWSPGAGCSARPGSGSGRTRFPSWWSSFSSTSDTQKRSQNVFVRLHFIFTTILSYLWMGFGSGIVVSSVAWWQRGCELDSSCCNLTLIAWACGSD